MVRADSSSLVRRAVEDEGNALQTVTASSLSSKSHFSEMDERWAGSNASLTTHTLIAARRDNVKMKEKRVKCSA